MFFMNFDDYQKKAGKTAQYPKLGEKYVYPILGLVGETGEVAEKIKKVLRNDGGKSQKKKGKIWKRSWETSFGTLLNLQQN